MIWNEILGRKRRILLGNRLQSGRSYAAVDEKGYLGTGIRRYQLLNDFLGI